MDKITDEPIPEEDFDIIGPISQGIAIADKLYQEHKTNEYRDLVKELLTEIEDGIEQIEKILKELKHDLDFFEAWNNAGNPIYGTTGIHNLYKNWQLGQDDMDSRDILQQVELDMVAINSVVMGEDIQRTPIAELYNNVMGDHFHGSSRIEMLYMYFKCVIVGNMLKGLALMKPYAKDKKYEEFNKWKKILFELPHFYFLEMGKTFQHVADGMETSDYWAPYQPAHDYHHMWSYSAKYIWPHGRSIFPLNDNHVVVGYDFCEYSGQDIRIKIWHGPLVEGGYVDPAKIETSFVRGRKKMSLNNVSHGHAQHSYDTLENKVFCGPVNAPAGHVILSIKWDYEEKTQYFPNGETPAHNLVTRTYFLTIQHCKIDKGGKLDLRTKAWLKPELNSQVEGFFNSIDSVNLTHWANYRGDPTLWKVPISGVTFNRTEGYCDFRVNIHEKSFTSHK